MPYSSEGCLRAIHRVARGEVPRIVRKHGIYLYIRTVYVKPCTLRARKMHFAT